MSAILTTAGAAHLTELNQGQFPSNAFNGLVFDRGNVDPGAADTLALFQQRELVPLKVVDGYPKRDDRDGRNTGSGTSTWTWRFEREAAGPFVASNVAITNYSGGALISSAPLCVHAKQVVAQRFDERLVIWVNAAAGEAPTVVVASEPALQRRVQRLVGHVANTAAAQSAPGGSVVDSSTVRTQTYRGQSVWTAAYVLGREGRALIGSDIDEFTMTEERFDASLGEYVPTGVVEDVDCACSFFPATQKGDTRWNVEGGYNVAHTRTQLPRSDEGTFRLTYRMRLCDDDVREWRNIVEVRS